MKEPPNASGFTQASLSRPTIRRAGRDAAEILQTLWVESFRQAYKDVHSEEDIRAYCNTNHSRAEALRILTDDASDCAIAWDARENPAGFYIVTHHNCPIEDLKGAASELKQIYVLKDYYGAGVGKALYEDALEKIRARARAWAWLIVSDKNKRARAFYQKQNFRRLGRGPVLEVGADRLTSSVLVRAL